MRLRNFLEPPRSRAEFEKEYSDTLGKQDEGLKELLLKLARAEEVHHLKLMSLLPKPHDASELVLDGEVAILSGYGQLIDREPNEGIRDAFFHMFQDHLMHAEYAAGIVNQKGCDPNTFTMGADLSGGRPLSQQFMKPEKGVWQGQYGGSYDKGSVDPMTLINVDMCGAAEVAAWDNYMCAMMQTDDQDIRLHYGAFQTIEGQHVAIAGSLKDPSETPLERMIVHEAVEISSYGMMMNSEVDDRVKQVFQDLYREDMEHGRLLGQFAK